MACESATTIAPQIQEEMLLVIFHSQALQYGIQPGEAAGHTHPGQNKGDCWIGDRTPNSPTYPQGYQGGIRVAGVFVFEKEGAAGFRTRDSQQALTKIELSIRS
jgi:hypothetical protein